MSRERIAAWVESAVYSTAPESGSSPSTTSLRSFDVARPGAHSVAFSSSSGDANEPVPAAETSTDPGHAATDTSPSNTSDEIRIIPIQAVQYSYSESMREHFLTILDDRTYGLQTAYLHASCAALPIRQRIPDRMNSDHRLRCQVLLGLGPWPAPTVPALFWSTAEYFVRAVDVFAEIYEYTQAQLYATTAHLRRDLSYDGAFVGWLPLDFGIGESTSADRLRRGYLDELWPGIDSEWAFTHPLWSTAVLSTKALDGLAFGVALPPIGLWRALEAGEVIRSIREEPQVQRHFYQPPEQMELDGFHAVRQDRPTLRRVHVLWGRAKATCIVL